MKKAILFLSLVSSLQALAQAMIPQLTSQPRPFALSAFRDGPVYLRVKYPASVTKAKAVAYKSSAGTLLSSNQQPRVIDSTATGLTLYWPSGKILPPTSYLAVSLNNSVMAYGPLNVSYASSPFYGVRDTLSLPATLMIPTLQFATPSNVPGIMGGRVLANYLNVSTANQDSSQVRLGSVELKGTDGGPAAITFNSYMDQYRGLVARDAGVVGGTVMTDQGLQIFYNSSAPPGSAQYSDAISMGLMPDGKFVVGHVDLIGDGSAEGAHFIVDPNRGTVLPKFTTVQRNAMTSKDEGQLIYNLTTHKYEYWNGTAWTALGQ